MTAPALQVFLRWVALVAQENTPVGIPVARPPYTQRKKTCDHGLNILIGFKKKRPLWNRRLE
jgi:hypothetical protein